MVSKAVEYSTNPTITTNYSYNAADVETSETSSAIYLNLFGADGIIGRENASGGWSQYIFDYLGNTAIRTDKTATAQAEFIYDAYGEYGGTGTPDPFMYQARSGCYYDTSTGCYLCGHRFYDCSLGRFLNRDPISYSGGTNLYGYCAGNPVGRSDPSGLQDPSSQEEETELAERTGGSGYMPVSASNYHRNYGRPAPWEVAGPAGPADAACSSPGTPSDEPYPPNGGFTDSGPIAGGRTVTLLPGRENVNQLQRWGSLDGTYVAPLGASEDSVSLTPSKWGSDPWAFYLNAPCEAQIGYARPWYGLQGGGWQYKFGSPLFDTPITRQIADGPWN